MVGRGRAFFPEMDLSVDDQHWRFPFGVGSEFTRADRRDLIVLCRAGRPALRSAPSKELARFPPQETLRNGGTMWRKGVKIPEKAHCPVHPRQRPRWEFGWRRLVTPSGWASTDDERCAELGSRVGKGERR